MLNYVKRRDRTPEQKRLDDAKYCLWVAHNMWNYAKKNADTVLNITIYNVLETLARIPGVNICVEDYDYLKLWRPDLDMDALRVAKEKLDQATAVVQSMEKEVS